MHIIIPISAHLLQLSTTATTSIVTYFLYTYDTSYCTYVLFKFILLHINWINIDNVSSQSHNNRYIPICLAASRSTSEFYLPSLLV